MVVITAVRVRGGRLVRPIETVDDLAVVMRGLRFEPVEMVPEDRSLGTEEVMIWAREIPEIARSYPLVTTWPGRSEGAPG